MAKIHILGAGLSGMVAAINLARDGHEVLVLEGHKGIGGLKGVHPSAHTTPIDPVMVSNYTGIDVTPSFKPILDFRLGVLNRLYACRSETLFCVERGDRPTSIDTLLHDECLRCGVAFEFNTFIKDPNLELPPDSILATGLHTEIFNALQVPYETVYSFWMTAERDSGIFESLKAGFEQLLVGYLFNYTTDYFYVTAMNNLWYALLFSRRPLKKSHLTQCLATVEDRLGVRLTGWKYLTGCVPTKSLRNPRLFLGDKILTGSLSGSMDPFYLFGIHGALLSGKIAAMAIQDPDRAEAEFKRINRSFISALLQRRLFERNPLRHHIFNLLLRVPRVTCGLSRFATMGIPGYVQGHFPKRPMVSSIRRTG
jgi:hypothetical protein